MNSNNGHDKRGGFSAPRTQELVGITYRQLDHWDRTELLQPSIQQADGSGSRRIYSFEDVVVLRAIKGLLEAGMSLSSIRKAIDKLREILEEGADLSQMRLVAQGDSIFTITTENELIDLLRGGQGVFLISLGPLHQQLGTEVIKFDPDLADSIARPLQPELIDTSAQASIGMARSVDSV